MLTRGVTIVDARDGLFGKEITTKRIIAVMLVLTMLLMSASGCKQAQMPSKRLVAVYDTNWETDNGYYKEDVLPNEEAAEAVAQEIFDSIKGECAKNCVVQYTTYYEAQNAWMVYFDEPWLEGEMVKLGGGCTIALNKADGQVMRIFWW